MFKFLVLAVTFALVCDAGADKVGSTYFIDLNLIFLKRNF